MERLIIYAHIFCGSLVLFIGFILVISRKGTLAHKKLGWAYIFTMFAVSISAIYLLVFYRFSLFLLVIAQITLYSSFSTIRIFRIQRSKTLKWYDESMMIITLLFGTGLILMGIYKIILPPNSIYMGSLSIIFGSLAFFGSISDLKNYKLAIAGKLDSTWWKKQHISAAGGSFIAAVTAFSVQMGNLLFLYSTIGWLLWVIPTIIGTPLIMISIKRHIKISDSIKR